MSLGRSIQSFSFVKHLPPAGGVGLSVLRSGVDDIQGRNAMNEPTKTLSSQEIQGIISFGVSIGIRMALGINIKAFFSSIAPEIIDVQSGSGIGWDVGFIYKLHRHLILGGVMENLNGSYIWKITKWDKEVSYEEIMPQNIKLGMNYTGFRDMSIYFQEDIVNIPDKYINYRIRLGMEYRLSNNVKLRLGFKQAQGALTFDEGKNSNNLKPSFGAGIPLKLWKRQYMQMDYALDPGNVDEGLSHLFSFSMELR